MQTKIILVGTLEQKKLLLDENTFNIRTQNDLDAFFKNEKKIAYFHGVDEKSFIERFNIDANSSNIIITTATNYLIDSLMTDFLRKSRKFGVVSELSPSFTNGIKAMPMTRAIGVTPILIQQDLSFLKNKHKAPLGKTKDGMTMPSFFHKNNSENLVISTKYSELSLTPNILKRPVPPTQRLFDIGRVSNGSGVSEGLTIEQLTQFVGEENSIKKGGMTALGNEFLKILSEKNETIITIDNPMEIDIPNNIDDTSHFSKETIDMLEKNAQEWARKYSPLGFMTNSAHNLMAEDFSILPTEREFKIKAKQLKDTGKFKNLADAQKSLAIKYGFKNYNAIKPKFAKVSKINVSMGKREDIVSFGLDAHGFNAEDMGMYEKAKILILNHLYTIESNIPIIVITTEKVQNALKLYFKDKLEEMTKYPEEILFTEGRKFENRVFKICTKEEISKLNKRILLNSKQYDVSDNTFLISPKNIGRFNMVNIIGRTGSGKSSLFPQLGLDKKNTIIIDGKNDVTFQNEFKESKFIEFNPNNIGETLSALRNEFDSNEPKFLILDDLPFYNLFQEHPYFFRDFHKWAMNTTIIIGSQEKFDKDINTGFKYLKINSLRDVENLKELIDYNISKK